jgi:hypothetical protein
LPETTATRTAYVVGGQQREGRPLLASPNWYEYQRGLVLRVDLDSGHVERCLDYVSPAEVRPDGNSPVLFKCGSLVDNKLYVCTHSEILIYTVPSMEQVGYLTLPCFNDLHHVLPTKAGTLLVVNTGLDALLEVTLSGEVVREWAALEGEQTWERFSRSVDYRKIASTKPHLSHPNQIFYLGDELWLTRFEQRDAISLTDSRRRIDIGLERVHDGVVSGNSIFFTTVKGDVVIANAETLEIEQVFDVLKFHPKGTLLGWCRGLMVDGDKVWVGFSHFRPTKFRENVSWLAHGFRYPCKPTHIGCYDLSRGKCVMVIPLEGCGLDAVFSILPASKSERSAREPEPIAE